MGQARRNGTYEERKAKAIAAGREQRVEAPNTAYDMSNAQILSAILSSVSSRSLSRLRLKAAAAEAAKAEGRQAQEGL